MKLVLVNFQHKVCAEYFIFSVNIKIYLKSVRKKNKKVYIIHKLKYVIFVIIIKLRKL